MNMAGPMTIGIYMSEVREITRCMGYIVINQSHWYREDLYTEEQAVKKFLERRAAAQKEGQA